jgi:hypothetical protein
MNHFLNFHMEGDAYCVLYIMQVDGKSGPAVFSSMSTWLEPPLGTPLQHPSARRKQFLQQARSLF